ncbi:MAG: hypothetical protein FJY98_04020 [Candidatus Liptonbacteria bacterium]|nr:hypothetical protein [Candidatus Liptonbacteria bacterium]
MNQKNTLTSNNSPLGTLPCIICHKKLEHAVPEVGEGNQPDCGVACTTPGHYGSRVFDPDDGHFLEFNVCDDCLRKAAAEHLIALGFKGRDSLRLWAPGIEDFSDN